MGLGAPPVWTRRAAALALAAAVAAVGPAWGQVRGPGSRAAATAEVVARIVAASPEASLVSAGMPTVTSVDADYVELTATVQVRSDAPFRVVAVGTSASRVEVLTVAGRYEPLSAAGVTVLAGPSTGSIWQGSVHYRVARPRGTAQVLVTLPVRYTVTRLGAAGT